MVASGRDSRMPNNSPLITVPTIWPRRRSGARCATTGRIICVPTAVMPSSSVEAMKIAGGGRRRGDQQARRSGCPA